MEGKFRPGHFDGVGTIVKRLFEIVKPTNAYFGEKDFQQLQIVKKMVEKTKLPVKVIGCPIFREANGLAMSSRNERLSNAERKEASNHLQNYFASQEFIQNKISNRSNRICNQNICKTNPFRIRIFSNCRRSNITTLHQKKQSKKIPRFHRSFC